MWRSEPELVNPVERDAIPGFAKAIRTAFLIEPDPIPAYLLENAERQWDPARNWGVRDNGRWVATLRTLDRTLTIPGPGGSTRLLKADALTAVTVASTHRRRGLMSAMLTGSLKAARDRGDALTILTAAEWPIYGRHGYAVTALGADYSFHVRRRGANVDGDLTCVHQVEIEEFGKAAPGVFDAFTRLRAGQVDRGGEWWNRALGLGGWPKPDESDCYWILHEGDDGPDGLLAWKPDGEFPFVPPLSKVKVPTLAAANDIAYRDLWAYLSGIDGAEEIQFHHRPIDEPARWLLADGRTLLPTEVRDHLWLKLLDVPAALTARSYAIPGELVIEIIDETAVDVAGRYRLHADGDEASCERTSDAPDLTLDQRVLSAIYLGGFGLAELAIAGGVREHTAGAQARAQMMFRTPLAPWNATGF